MLIRMDRIMSAEQIRNLYQFPKDLFARVLPSIPVLCIGDDGQPCYLESLVDEFLKRLARTLDSSQAKPGRPDSTIGIAEFINQMKKSGQSWKDIYAACKRQWPGDSRVMSLPQIRDQWRRHFGDKR